MFNPSSVVIESFVDELVETYVNMYGPDEEDIHLIVSNARNALEIIANSDAPYHDVNHTIMVTMVGTEILRGKILIEGNVTADEWVHFVVSLLNHDIGYVRGICRADRSGRYAINMEYDTIAPPPGSTDAALTPYHVDRGKLYITERFQGDDRIDEEMICRNIERTRFPVPTEEDAQESHDFPGLIRAADLIGQLGDPQYHRKISALFAEFKETGQAAKMGYTTAADLREGYPGFFWGVVNPFITEALRYLRRTQEGQQWVANLYANVFTEEHEAPAYGPERRAKGERRSELEGVLKIKEAPAKDKRQDGRRLSDLPASRGEGAK
ncbi:MAG: metal-dependent phosphohydrolase [Proteobacteria bacterium]|nr:metal-dependent phosphohydrolase [Pseudomonadota bacterium]